MADEIKSELETNDVEGKESSATDASLNTEEQADLSEKEVESKRIPYERFKQKVDEANALKEKLAQIEREQAEAEKAELEAQNKYKELYEQAVQEKEQAEQAALSLRKTVALRKAGYSDEQSQLLVKLIEGDDDEAIAESIEQIKAIVLYTDYYADPSTFYGSAA